MDAEKKQFLKKFQQIRELPSLPEIVLKINDLLDAPDTSIDSLCEVIEKDQAIVFKMLLLVNSAFFGLREKISSVQEATIILGFDAIRNIVISLSAFNTLNVISDKKSINHFRMDGFWKHSVGVAVLSRYLSDKKQMGDPEKCFVAGLLHDMGKLILAAYFNKEFEKIIKLSKKEKILYREAEKQMIPGGHHEIGFCIARKWRIPTYLSNTLYCHHNMQIGATNYEDCLIVNAADGLINSYFSDFMNNNSHPGEIDYRYFDEQTRIKMQPWIESSSKWFPEVKEMISEARKLLFEK